LTVFPWQNGLDSITGHYTKVADCHEHKVGRRSSEEPAEIIHSTAVVLGFQ